MTQFDLSFLAANSAQESFWDIIKGLSPDFPELTITAIFIWAEGYVLSIFFFQGERFERYRNDKLFRHAIGVVWTSIFLLGYSLITLRRLPSTAEELRAVALPCAIISSSVTLCICLYVLKRDCRSKISDSSVPKDRISIPDRPAKNDKKKASIPDPPIEKDTTSMSKKE